MASNWNGEQESQGIPLIFQRSSEVNPLEIPPFRWDTESPEMFKQRPIFYDIRALKKVLAETKHPIYVVPIEPFREMVENFAERGLWRNPKKPVNLDVPIILMKFGVYPEGLMVLDGWQRIAEALKIGRQTLPCVLPSNDEVRSCAVVPPEGSVVLTPAGTVLQLYGE